MHDAIWYLALLLAKRLGLREAKPAVQATYDFLKEHGAPKEELDDYLAAVTHMARVVKGREECGPLPTPREPLFVDMSVFEHDRCRCPGCQERDRQTRARLN